MEQMFFDGWDGMARTVVVGMLAYLGLVVMLRLSGKRTLSKLNAFDLVVTVALGSILATILLSREVPLVDGLVAFVLLIALQFAVTWTSVRMPWFRGVVASEPTLLMHRGQMLDDALHRARITPEEVRSAIRGAGMLDLDGVAAVVLEPDGSLSVLGSSQAARTSIAELEPS